MKSNINLQKSPSCSTNLDTGLGFYGIDAFVWLTSSRFKTTLFFFFCCKLLFAAYSVRGVLQCPVSAVMNNACTSHTDCFVQGLSEKLDWW